MKTLPPNAVVTQNGFFTLEDPVFDIADIAHSLSMLCRFNGHCNRFFSVAEHSIMVARIMEYEELGDPREGLLHDAVEAYLSDVPAPFKSSLPDWRALEKRLDFQFRERFGLPVLKTPGCDMADWMALFIEADANMPGGGTEFADPKDLRDRALALKHRYPLRFLEPGVAKMSFASTYDLYYHDTRKQA